MRKKIITKYLLHIATLTIVLCFPVSSKAQTRSVVIAATEWGPYTSPVLQNGGFLTEIVTTAFRRVGYATKVIFIPWIRGIEMTKNGKYDTLLGTSYTKDRSAYFLYPNYSWKTEIFFFKRAGNVRQYTTLKALCNSRIATLRGSFYFKRLRKLSCLQVNEVNGISQSINMLMSNRIDLFIESKDAVDYILDTESPELKNEIEPMYPSFEFDKIYLVVSKKHPQAVQIASDFDRGIKLIQSNGTYQKILIKNKIKPILQK